MQPLSASQTDCGECEGIKGTCFCWYYLLCLIISYVWLEFLLPAPSEYKYVSIDLSSETSPDIICDNASIVLQSTLTVQSCNLPRYKTRYFIFITSDSSPDVAGVIVRCQVMTGLPGGKGAGRGACVRILRWRYDNEVLKLYSIPTCRDHCHQTLGLAGNSIRERDEQRPVNLIITRFVTG